MDKLEIEGEEEDGLKEEPEYVQFMKQFEQIDFTAESSMLPSLEQQIKYLDKFKREGLKAGEAEEDKSLMDKILNVKELEKLHKGLQKNDSSSQTADKKVAPLVQSIIIEREKRQKLQEEALARRKEREAKTK